MNTDLFIYNKIYFIVDILIKYFYFCCRKLPPAVSKEFVVEEMRLLDELLYPGVHGLYIRNNLSRLQNIFEMNNLTIPIIMNSVCNKFFKNQMKFKMKTTNFEYI